MAVRTKDEILNALKAKFAEDSSDEVLAIIEDVTDTFDDFDSKTKDSTDWKTKYEENDKSWRDKYKARFFDSGDNRHEEHDDPDDNELDNQGHEDNSPKTFEDLFKTE